MTTPSRLKICLLSESPLVENAVRLAAPDADVRVFSIEQALTSENTLSAEGSRTVQGALDCDAALIEWSFDRAPELNTICFHIRRSVRLPVFMLTTRAGEEPIAAIAAGADDALAFPLDVSLIRAKILAYHRLVRAVQEAGGLAATAPGTRDVAEFGPLTLDRTSYRFYVHDTEIELTPREHALIDFLIRHHDELCTRDSILDHVWGINFDTGTNMVDVYMYFLRKKLESRGLSSMIETIRGRGYRLVLPS